ncbi:MAG: hypothetical protein E6J90_50765 [Deltaproteobacteria bacterium]|nr:MAG: hypothetical protein E6J90_50765 [Deltaproteobacteria bacterium]TMQ04806.1 MAG: hypothetical protein E6J91_42500 [Deltaproteobacteria bacterium]
MSPPRARRDRERREPALGDQLAGQRAAQVVQLVRAVAGLADQHEARRAELIEHAVEVVLAVDRPRDPRDCINPFTAETRT